MRTPAIAPSAQRLAEENNVNWRALRGSGDGGSVVERDVLEYLTRVMRGEEATDPTPEPLPEGLSAWAEEPERRRGGAGDLFAAPFVVPEVAPGVIPPAAEPVAEPVAEPGGEAAPWTFEAAATKPEPPRLAAWEDDAPFRPPPAEELAEPDAEHAEPGAPGVPEAVHRAALAELETLKARLAALEEERLRHVNELHQLSRLQETIALQKTEGTKLAALQREVEGLRELLADAQGEARRAQELATQNQDLEARLTRARRFRDRAKAEFERVLTANAALEHELTALKKRPRWKFWTS